MRRSRRRAGWATAAILTSAAIVVAGAGTPAHSAFASGARQSAVAAPTHSHRLIVSAASPVGYLVYARYPTGHPGLTPGVLRVLSLVGHRHTVALGSIPATTARIQLAGSMVVMTDSEHPHHVSWWDLAVGSSGSTTMGGHDYPLGATPDGWIFTHIPTFVPGPTGIWGTTSSP